MEFLLELLLSAAALVFMARALPSVHVRSYGTAVAVALVIALLNATIGALIRFPLNLVTLFLLGFVVRLLVSALMIKLADKLFSGFEVKGFGTALIIAVVMSLVGTVVRWVF